MLLLNFSLKLTINNNMRALGMESVPDFREEINMCWLEDLLLEYIIRKTTQSSKAGPSSKLKKVKRSYLSKLQRMEVDWPSS